VRVTHLHRWPAESAPARSAGPGVSPSELLSAALGLALEWAGEPRAVLLSGSHAAGDAVWAGVEGGQVSLSDVDLYVLLDDDAACRAARSRRRPALRGLARRCLAFGLAAPLEAGFLTAAGLARLPARPGSLELARHGRVIRGDAHALDLVPRWRPGDVSAEEILLLLENRGCELLWSRPRLASSDPLARLQGRHSVLKCALDLAGVAALLGGEYPEGAPARVAWARQHRTVPRDAREQAEAEELDRLWDSGLSWRRGEVAARAPALAEEEWAAAVRGWARAWQAAGARSAPVPAEPVARALALARRARLRRRVREALAPDAPGGPGRRALLAHAADGTLRHRVHASATLLLLAAAGGAGHALPPPVSAALARLGVVPRAACAAFDEAAAAVVRAWDRWLLDGQRTAEPA